MQNQQFFINQKYHSNRLSSISSINNQTGSNEEQQFDIDTGILAAFFTALGIKQAPDGIGSWIEDIFSGSMAKIFMFGFNTLPQAGYIGKLPGILDFMKLEDLGILNYASVLKAGILHSQRRH